MSQEKLLGGQEDDLRLFIFLLFTSLLSAVVGDWHLQAGRVEMKCVTGGCLLGIRKALVISESSSSDKGNVFQKMALQPNLAEQQLKQKCSKSCFLLIRKGVVGLGQWEIWYLINGQILLPLKSGKLKLTPPAAIRSLKHAHVQALWRWDVILDKHHS